MAEAKRSPLPEFDQPPVVETVLGVDFAPLEGWNITMYGRLHQHFREQYPAVQTQEPLPPQIEDFTPKGQQQVWSFNFSGAPDARCWFIDRTDTQLLQVQADKFLRNWRKRQGAEYPRYPAISKGFQADWDRFLGFLRAEGLPQPATRQCEISYINHIEQSPAALADVFSFWRRAPERGFLPGPENASFRLSFRVPEKPSRLHVALEPAVRVQDGKELLQLTLTARGRPAGTATGELMEWFNLGHEWLVRGFDELTSVKMHREWKKRGTL